MRCRREETLKEVNENIKNEEYFTLIQSMINKYSSNLTVEELAILRDELNKKIYNKRPVVTTSSMDWNFECGF